jgi:iron complex outermembrane receptor protein
MKYSLLSCAILASFLPATTHAFEEEASAKKKKKKNEPEVIMVTAQKRAQNINEIGIAVTAFNGDDIKNIGAGQPLDLAAQTSNLNINNTFQNSVPNVSIRGLGLNDYAVNNNPAAGLYIDEVYLSSPAMLSFQLFDVERVEVLKGPQGTLYGRNTTAGTVTFVSKKPNDITEGYFSLDYGTYGRTAIEGAITGEITEGLNGRFSAKTVRQSEGHQTNRETGEDVGEVDMTSWRALLNWMPNDDIDVLVNIHGGTDKSDTWLVKVDNQTTADDDKYANIKPYESAGRDDHFVDIKSVGASIIVNWEINNDLSLTSVTGYEKYERQHVEDRDGTALVQLDGEYLNTIEQQSQEIRFTYDKDDLVLIGGAFYGIDEIKTRDRFDVKQLIPTYYSLGNEYKQKAKTGGLFLHSENQLDDDFKLTAGVRYTDETKDFFDAFAFAYIDAHPTNGGTQFDVYDPVSNDYSVNDLSGKIGIDYSGLDDTLLYASISKGFKSGNFQGQLSFDPTALDSFKEEEVIAYEMGFKSSLNERSVQLNGSVFFYDYQDMQMYGPLYYSEVLQSPLFGIDNVGDATLQGLELDLAWAATEELTIKAGLGLLDTEVTKSVVVGVKNGSELPNSPSVNFNSNIRYNWELTENLLGDIIFTSSYKGDVKYDIVNQPQEAIESGYWLHNIRVGISSIDEDWSVYLYAKNIADKRYRTQVLNSSVGYSANYGMPRTVGISLSYNF